MRILRNQGKTLKYLSDMFGVCETVVLKICKKHHGSMFHDNTPRLPAESC